MVLLFSLNGRKGLTVISPLCEIMHIISIVKYVYFTFCPRLDFCCEQTQNRMKLMADSYEDGHLKTQANQTNHKPSPDQVGQLHRVKIHQSEQLHSCQSHTHTHTNYLKYICTRHTNIYLFFFHGLSPLPNQG